MLLSNPIWLWALAGLAIPIGIHLLSRKEGQIIRIGSLRHLQETNTQQFKGIRLNEIVLLALRCALIVLFVLILSGLSFESEKAANVKWILVEKGLENLPEVKSQLDTFRSDGYEVRWLSAGFPSFDDSAAVTAGNLYWRLAEQLEQEKADEVVVIAKNNIHSFKGKRAELPVNIRWISIPTKAEEFNLKANAQGDSIIVRTGISGPERTEFTTQVFSRKDWSSSRQVQEIDTMAIVIASDNGYQYDKKIVEASLQALRTAYPIHIEIVPTLPGEIGSVGFGDWCIWLSSQPVPNSVDSNVILLRPASNQDIIVHDKPNRWTITKRLNEEVALNESLTVKLGTLFLPSDHEWTTAYANDRRMVSDENAWSSSESGKSEQVSRVVQSADSYLLVVFLLTLLGERIVAYYRNQ